MVYRETSEIGHVDVRHHFMWKILVHGPLGLFKGSRISGGVCVKCLFIKEFPDGAKIFLLNYVDDMIYYGTDQDKLQLFEQQTGKRFNLELLGQAHWYLGNRMRQLADFDIELDQSRYFKSLVKRYLETAGCPKVLRYHTMPLPSGFIPTCDDCSSNEHDAQQLSLDYNIDFASCVWLLIYLSMMHTDIIYAINKLAKYTRLNGRPHFEALTHLLRYLRDKIMYGLRYDSNIGDSPIYQMLLSQSLQE